jgi:hypothetical protein
LLAISTTRVQYLLQHYLLLDSLDFYQIT